MKRFFNSLKNAANGLREAHKEPNFRIEIFAVFLAVALGLTFSISLTQWLILIIFISLVFALELINTSIEILTDIASPFINPKAKAVKDIASAAVMLAAIGALIGGLLIFLPYLFDFFKSVFC